jgi:hypothetical protein
MHGCFSLPLASRLKRCRDEEGFGGGSSELVPGDMDMPWMADVPQPGQDILGRSWGQNHSSLYGLLEDAWDSCSS